MERSRRPEEIPEAPKGTILRQGETGNDSEKIGKGGGTGRGNPPVTSGTTSRPRTEEVTLQSISSSKSQWKLSIDCRARSPHQEEDHAPTKQKIILKTFSRPGEKKF